MRNVPEQSWTSAGIAAQADANLRTFNPPPNRPALKPGGSSVARAPRVAGELNTSITSQHPADPADPPDPKRQVHRHTVREAWQLAQHGHSSWWGDLCLSLLELPVSVLVNLEEMPTVDIVRSALAQVELSLTRHLFDAVMTSERLPVLQARFRRLVSPIKLSHVCRQRPYLAVTNPKHREALVRLLSSDHPLGVEEGRRQGWDIPRHRRVCRFCRRRWAIEDEVHALLECEDPRLALLRDVDLLSALERQEEPLPGARRMYARMPSWDFLDYLLRTSRLLTTVARFVYLVFELVESAPPLFPASESEWLELAM
ncbi:hypothetical protein K466DRAFT_599629 [Polyporus arcularius HHB13444]|uniref:Uncharacterized protein n=1 Tax=Polyporus arcularius HHB13444 TaxID=1314778 RepID=A0A5C3PGF9_9APHY|nr:hypothetical protein K466DRAFT_599629 [Polyporus arcularius HHB13444]